MKTIIFLIGLVSVVSCQTSKVVVTPTKRYYTVVNTNDSYFSQGYDSLAILQDDLKLLAWLKTQPKEVVDAFKRDFIMTNDELNKFVDSIKVIKP